MEEWSARGPEAAQDESVTWAPQAQSPTPAHAGGSRDPAWYLGSPHRGRLRTQPLVLPLLRGGVPVPGLHAAPHPGVHLSAEKSALRPDCLGLSAVSDSYWLHHVEQITHCSYFFFSVNRSDNKQFSYVLMRMHKANFENVLYTLSH